MVNPMEGETAQLAAIRLLSTTVPAETIKKGLQVRQAH